MIDYGKRLVLDVLVDAVDLEAAVNRISYFAVQRRPFSVAAVAAHGIVEARQDPRLAAAINDFDLVLPDGQPVRWALNSLYGLDLLDKVPGPSVMDELLARAAEDSLAVHFYGSTDETLRSIVENLDHRFGRSLTVTATPSRFEKVGVDDLRTLADEINRTGANLCFVGLGCPRQERFVSAVGPRLQMPAIAVGAAFDFTAGFIRRAPLPMQRLGLEWAYRLAQEPRRLARRYASTNSAFMLGVAEQLVSTRLVRQDVEPAMTGGPAQWATVDA